MQYTQTHSITRSLARSSIYSFVRTYVRSLVRSHTHSIRIFTARQATTFIFTQILECASPLSTDSSALLSLCVCVYVCCLRACMCVTLVRSFCSILWGYFIVITVIVFFSPYIGSRLLVSGLLPHIECSTRYNIISWSMRDIGIRMWLCWNVYVD